jgi:hypothetical protein
VTAPDEGKPEEGPRAPVARPAIRMPWLKDDRPGSIRHPWSRSVLGAAIGLLLPFVWVLEVEECGSHESVELTGMDLVRQLEPEEPEVWGLVLAAALCLAAPWIAAAMVRVSHRLGVHVAGLVVSLLTSLFGTAMMFLTVFSHRTLRLAGNVALVLLVLLSVDAIVRFGLGLREWLEKRRAGTPDG